MPYYKDQILSVFVQLKSKDILRGKKKKHWSRCKAHLKSSFTFGCIFFVYYKHLFNLLQFEVKNFQNVCSTIIIKMFAAYKTVSRDYFTATSRPKSLTRYFLF